MLPKQKVWVKWSAGNKEWYEKKGYIFTDYRDRIEVDVEELPPNSRVHIKYLCDKCDSVMYMEWKEYQKRLKSSGKGKIVCSGCMLEKANQTREERYGTPHPWYVWQVLKEKADWL